jgi:hypothetical protein
VLYSDALRREVRPSEACFGAPENLLMLMGKASDAPRDKRGELDLDALPGRFKKWAPHAWAELLGQLPDEDQAEEVSDSAGEDFRAAMSAVLYHIVPLGREVRQGDQTETRVERRSLIDAARVFARPGSWQSVRDYQIWCRQGEGGALEVAIRSGLLSQVPSGTLAGLKPKQFAHKCALYDVGAAGDDCRPGGSRAVRLAPAFLAELLARPELPIPNSNPQASSREKTTGESATEGEKPYDAST